MRNAEKDREIIAAATEGPWELVGDREDRIETYSVKIVGYINDCDDEDKEFIVEAREAFPHYLERAVAAEQRVAELERKLDRIHTAIYTIEVSYDDLIEIIEQEVGK